MKATICPKMIEADKAALIADEIARYTRKAAAEEILKEVDRKIEQCKRSFNSGTDKECRHGVMVLEELKGFIKEKFGVE